MLYICYIPPHGFCHSIGCVGGAATTQRWYGEDKVVTPMAVAWSRSLGLRKLIYYHFPGANTSKILR